MRNSPCSFYFQTSKAYGICENGKSTINCSDVYLISKFNYCKIYNPGSSGLMSRSTKSATCSYWSGRDGWNRGHKTFAQNHIINNLLVKIKQIWNRLFIFRYSNKKVTFSSILIYMYLITKQLRNAIFLFTINNDLLNLL